MKQLLDNPEGFRKLLKLYYDVDVSVAFLQCAASQLSADLHAVLREKQPRQVRLLWRPEKEWSYQRGNTSFLQAELLFIHGVLPVIICWQSVSGKVYEPDDPDISNKDVRFAFSELNVESAVLLQHPLYRLVNNIALVACEFKKRYNLVVSSSFLTCMNAQLSDWFEKTTGSKINSKISLNLFREPVVNSYLEKLKEEKFLSVLSIHNNRNDVEIGWTSKSGRKYRHADPNIDARDISFFFEGFDVEKYCRQMCASPSIQTDLSVYHSSEPG